MKVDVDGYVHVVPVTPRVTALILETMLPEPERRSTGKVGLSEKA